MIDLTPWELFVQVIHAAEDTAYERAAITAEGLAYGNMKLVEAIRALKHGD